MGSEPPQGQSALPGQPAAIPIEPRPTTIILGVLFFAAGAWLAFSWIPAHRPIEAADYVVTSWSEVRVFMQDHLTPKGYAITWGLAAILMAIGLAAFVSGVTWRNYAETYCRKCQQRVVAKKGGLGLRCPNNNYGHYANLRALPVMLLVLVVVLFVPPLLAVMFGGAKVSWR